MTQILWTAGTRQAAGVTMSANSTYVVDTAAASGWLAQGFATVNSTGSVSFHFPLF